ncbi:hypothetical protein [Neptuniibacter sp. QD37_11]|uniref:hypothetical protein n=1 Tax=Neptuniibacter sp. QD37_11 TaxID=3398209 RepID=UPI0039F56096
MPNTNNIEPILKKLAEECASLDIPLFVCTETGEREFSHFILCSKALPSKFRQMDHMANTASFDDFLRRVISDAKKAGHSSAFLHAMGVPFEPHQIYTIPRRTRFEEMVLQQ